MWTPTHAQVTVHQARNLIPKGKSGTNDVYVTIALGKEKYQTSVKERAEAPVWHEECDLLIPDLATSAVSLTVYHRNLLGLDEFLGQVDVPLASFQIYDRPKSKWFALKNKSMSSKKEKYRGELEVAMGFTVKNLSEAEREKIHGKLSGTGSEGRRKSSLLHSNSQSDLRIEQNKRRSGSIHNLFSDDNHSLTVHKDDIEIGQVDGPQRKVDSTPNSPAKLKKKKFFKSHELLPTDRTFSLTPDPSNGHDHPVTSVTDVSSPQNQPTDRKSPAPPKPPRAKKKSTSISESEVDTSPLTLSSPTETSESKQRLDTAAGDDSPFSRNTSARTAISRGSFKRSSAKSDTSSERGSDRALKKPATSLQGSPLLQAVVNRGGSERGSDRSLGNRSLTSLPEETGHPRVKDEVDSSTKENGGESVHSHSTASLHSGGNSVKEEDNNKVWIEIEPPKKRYSQCLSEENNKEHGKYDWRRHSLHGSIMDKKLAKELELQSNKTSTEVPSQIQKQFDDFSRDDLLLLIMKQQQQLNAKEQYQKDLEDYIDRLLVRVIECSPAVLQNPYETSQNKKNTSTSSLNSIQIHKYTPTPNNKTPVTLTSYEMGTNSTPKSTPQRVIQTANLSASKEKRKSIVNPFKKKGFFAVKS